jgi:plasmid stabilization system protein ParE
MFLKKLRSACRGLTRNPLRFPLASPERDPSIRKRPYGAYIILYEVGENAVSIARVLHSARDYEKVVFPQD